MVKIGFRDLDLRDRIKSELDVKLDDETIQHFLDILYNSIRKTGEVYHPDRVCLDDSHVIVRLGEVLVVRDWTEVKERTKKEFLMKHNLKLNNSLIESFIDQFKKVCQGRGCIRQFQKIQFDGLEVNFNPEDVFFLGNARGDW